MPASEGPVAVVTGGAGGIGEATAVCLLADGWRVVIADHDAERAAEVAARIGAVALALDIANAADVDDAVARVENTVGPCSGLVACAAHLENPHPPEAQDLDEFDRIMGVNLRGTFLTVARFGARMVARGHGSVVTVGSITAQFLAAGGLRPLEGRDHRHDAQLRGGLGASRRARQLRLSRPDPYAGCRGELCPWRTGPEPDDRTDRAWAPGGAARSRRDHRIPAVGAVQRRDGYGATCRRRHFGHASLVTLWGRSLTSAV
jgi:NAD(P)-dependent dehydrogenase (short-subunit alcohol dehydrogenase family)